MSKNKLLILSAAIFAAVAFTACQKNNALEGNETKIESSTTPVELGVSGITEGGPVGVASRAVGTILNNPNQITGEDIALYGVVEDFTSQTRFWTKANRLIDNLQARLEFDAAKNNYRFNYAADKAYYPANGFLNVYALYPSSGAYVQITDDGSATAPKADVSLGVDFASQYDVLHGYTEKLTVAQAQQAQVTFGHALAQLRIKIYRDPSITTAPTLSKVEVRGVSKASLASIERPAFTNSIDPLDSLDFVAFNGSTPISATTKETALALNNSSELMLFPGTKSIDKITITVDGNTFITYIPKTWDLMQGKVNTLTLTLRQFEVRLESPWETTPWGVGQGVDQGVENNGKIIQLSGKMVDASSATKVAYDGTAPVKADITLLGYTYKGVNIESVSGGVFTTAPFNSGSVNDNPLHLEGLTLYDALGNTLFAGQLDGGKLQSGNTLYIDQINKGLLKKDGESGAIVDLSMTFGGFGDGTTTSPYEVRSIFHLTNINKLLGRRNSTTPIGTSSSGAFFKQIDHIDFNGVAFTAIGTTTLPFYGSYNGNQKQLRNVNFTGTQHVGLFCAVGQKNTVGGTGQITNVVIASGQVTGANNSSYYTGSVVGNLLASGVVSQCENHSTILSGGVNNGGAGGLVGQMTNSSEVTKCANFGSVSGANAILGGIVGRSESSGAPRLIQNCYNAGTVSCTFAGVASASSIGGVAGYLLPTSSFIFSSNYNRGTVSHAKTGANVGALIGYLGGGSLSTVWGNSYYLLGGFAPIGSDLSNKTSVMVGTDVSGMKDSGTLTGLGAAFKADYTTNPINEGFPILSWQ